jgi:hypothetical protein
MPAGPATGRAGMFVVEKQMQAIRIAYSISFFQFEPMIHFLKSLS